MTMLAAAARALGAAAIALATALTAAAQDLPRLTIAAQAGGTVSWELDTIRHHGLDRAQGFELVVMEVAGKPAAQIAFQGGEADIIVDDWIWVARQRAEGQDIAFIPYSRQVGGVMVRPGSGIGGLADLVGRRIGIAGGPLDKSWLILRAHALAQGIDLAAQTEQVFGAPPLIFQAGLSGEVDAVVNFWHFMAKQEAAGMEHLISVAEAAEGLGMDPDLPLLGYVVHGARVAEAPELIAAFAAASRAAKDLLASSDAEWERLRPMMNAANDAEFAALVAGFRAGIPAPGPIDEAAARRMLAVMAELGGPELVGAAADLPEGTFVRLGS